MNNDMRGLEVVAAKGRLLGLDMVYHCASGHLGGSFSAMDILTVLYFDVMRVDPKDPKDPDRDRFVLSKGHCTPALYPILAQRGYFPEEELQMFRSVEGHMSGHAEMHHVKGVDMSTGSLGQGISAAVGMALAGKLDKKDYRVYSLLGDGEIEEGQVWEAFMAAAKYKLDNLCAVIDVNGLQIDGATADVMPTEPLDKKLEAFGWHVIKVDGHDLAALEDAFKLAQDYKGAPTMILAKTVKGKGVSFMENQAGWHGKAPNEEQYQQARQELVAALAEKIATRAAYGKALEELAAQEPNLVVLDADLSGSTMTKGFGAEHPDRFFDMGIAEANMVGVAAGLATCGKKPFVNSFAMFAAGRAWEQVRNSVAYPGLNVKVVGSHGGLSVGEDGATHQCIEDLAIMRAIPNMTVLCPCDGNEMKQAVKALLAYDGPAYLRLGRLAVETVTDQVEGYEFQIGKGVLLRDGQDVTVVAVGMMVQMALTAADILAEEGISVRVIDMHTIKPLDTEILLAAARDTGCIVTTEEANIVGGLGSAVSEYLTSVCPVPVIRHGVEDEFGRSGAAQKVLEAYHLTPAGIADKVRQALTLKQALTL